MADKTVGSVDLVALLTQLREDEAHYERQLAAVRDEIRVAEQVLAIAERRFAFTAVVPHRQPEAAELSKESAERTFIFVDQLSPPVKSAGLPVSPTFAAPDKPKPEARVAELARKVRGLTQGEALKRIAQYNEGIVRTIEAKPILIKAGLTRGNPKHVGTHIYHQLDASPEFEKIGPGVFRWVPYFVRLEAQKSADQIGPAESQPAEDRAGGDEEVRRDDQLPPSLRHGTVLRATWLPPQPSASSASPASPTPEEGKR